MGCSAFRIAISEAGITRFQLSPLFPFKEIYQLLPDIAARLLKTFCIYQFCMQSLHIAHFTILLISNIPHHTPQNSYNQLIVNVLFLRSGRCVCGEGLADDNAFQFFLHKLPTLSVQKLCTISNLKCAEFY